MLRILLERALKRVEAVLGKELSTNRLGRWMAESERRLKDVGGWILSFK